MSTSALALRVSLGQPVRSWTSTTKTSAPTFAVVMGVVIFLRLLTAFVRKVGKERIAALRSVPQVLLERFAVVAVFVIRLMTLSTALVMKGMSQMLANQVCAQATVVVKAAALAMELAFVSPVSLDLTVRFRQQRTDRCLLSNQLALLQAHPQLRRARSAMMKRKDLFLTLRLV